MLLLRWLWCDGRESSWNLQRVAQTGFPDESEHISFSFKTKPLWSMRYMTGRH
jgi:hypothetical protein